MREMGSPEFIDEMYMGPVVMFTVMPNGPMSIGRSLVMWFVFSLVVGLFAAYISSHALPAGADYRSVFRFVGATAFIGYALALWEMSI